jgi:hypothetical protein
MERWVKHESCKRQLPPAANREHVSRQDDERRGALERTWQIFTRSKARSL